MCLYILTAACFLPPSRYFQVSFSSLVQELLLEFRWENEQIYQDSSLAKDKPLHLMVISHCISEGVVVCLVAF